MEKVIVNKENCIGCGACMALASDVFILGDDGLAQTTENNVLESMDEELKQDVLDAIEGCPTSAIEKKDEEQ